MMKCLGSEGNPQRKAQARSRAIARWRTDEWARVGEFEMCSRVWMGGRWVELWVAGETRRRGVGGPSKRADGESLQ